MRLRTVPLALATVVAALTGSAIFDRVMAGSEPVGGAKSPTSDPVLSASLSRASRPIQQPRAAASPSLGGRGLRGMGGGGRMNGPMRGRR
jgi:hypothetical protein